MEKELKYTLKKGLINYLLEYSPIGWDTAEITVERSLETFGMTRSYKVDLEFTEDGAQILRNNYYNKLPDSCYLQIEKYNYLTFSYSVIYTGLIDFATFEDSELSVRVTVIDTNLAALIKKNFTTEYTVDTGVVWVGHREPPFDSYEFNVYPDENDLDYKFGAVKISDLTKYLFYKITGGYTSSEYKINVDAITALESGEVYPCLSTGLAIRGKRAYHFNSENRMMTACVSWDDYTKNLFRVFGLTWSIVIEDGLETLKFNSLDESFPDSEVYTATNISNFKVTSAQDFSYDKIDVGFTTVADDSDYDYDSNECLSVIKYNNKDNTTANKLYNLVPDWRADKLTFMQSKDTLNVDFSFTSNKDIYIVYVYENEDGNICFYYDLKTIIGELDPYSVYNVRLTASRLVRTHEKLINSFYWSNSDKLEHVEHLPDTMMNFTTVATGTEIVEFANIIRTGSYFNPIYFEFDCIIDDLVISDLYDPTNSLIEFEYEGETYKGYMINARVLTSGKNKVSLKLLSHADNDLTKLIR